MLLMPTSLARVKEMSSSHLQLARVVMNKHSLSIANQQFDLLIRLLQSDSSLAEEKLSECSEVFSDLEDIYLLTRKVADKIEILYQYISLCYQLPNKAISGAQFNWKLIVNTQGIADSQKQLEKQI
jgi:hypothetical protein